MLKKQVSAALSKNVRPVTSEPVATEKAVASASESFQKTQPQSGGTSGELPRQAEAAQKDDGVAQVIPFHVRASQSSKKRGLPPLVELFEAISEKREKLTQWFGLRTYRGRGGKGQKKLSFRKGGLVDKTIE